MEKKRENLSKSLIRQETQIWKTGGNGEPSRAAP